MQSDRYLTKPHQYNTVHTHGKALSEGPVLMKFVSNGLQHTRYGFSVGRRVGKAVTRNRVKRRMREVMRNMMLVPGWDIVFVARLSAAGSSYGALENSMANLLAKRGLLVRNNPAPTSHDADRIDSEA